MTEAIPESECLRGKVAAVTGAARGIGNRLRPEGRCAALWYPIAGDSAVTSMMLPST